eukprot:7380007-Prymnesium_polylepis.1
MDSRMSVCVMKNKRRAFTCTPRARVLARMCTIRSGKVVGGRGAPVRRNAARLGRSCAQPNGGAPSRTCAGRYDGMRAYR